MPRSPMMTLLAVAAFTGSAAQAQAQGAGTPTRKTIVTYVTGQSVYLAAGTKDSLYQDSRVYVLRGGAGIAELRVRYLSSHAASCEIVSSTAPVQVGDSVVYTLLAEQKTLATMPSEKSAAVAATTATTGSDSTPRPAARSAPPRPRMGGGLRAWGLRGRIGFRYLSVSQPDSGMGSFTQPALDIRLDGQNLGGSPIGLTIDARGRQTIARSGSGISTTDNATRVYQAALVWNPVGSGGRVTVGRQFSAALANVSLFDGLTAQLDRRTWGLGAFGGTEPDPDLGYSSEVKEYGAYVQLHSPPLSRQMWSLTTGAIDSYDNGQVNREYMYVQGIYTDHHLSGYAAQEIDYNRGWKRSVGEPVLQPTSTFATVQYRFTDALGINAGFDNRRNVRLYRDYVSPETQFDDSFRQGVWGGAFVNAFRHLRLGADVRASSGGPSGNADSYTGSMGLERFTPLQLALRGRATRYTSDRLNGWLYSGALSVQPYWALHLELNGGLRSERGTLGISALPSDTTLTRVHWIGLDADVALARQVYLLLSASRERGGFESNDQLYASLSIRF